MAAPKSRSTTTMTVTPIRRKSPAKAAAIAGFPAGLEPAPLVANLMNHQGFVTVEKVAATFGMSKGQLAETIGLSREALYKLARLEAPKTQSRLKEMLEIVSRVSGWAGGKEQAMACIAPSRSRLSAGAPPRPWSRTGKPARCATISTTLRSAALLEVSGDLLPGA